MLCTWHNILYKWHVISQARHFLYECNQSTCTLYSKDANPLTIKLTLKMTGMISFIISENANIHGYYIWQDLTFADDVNKVHECNIDIYSMQSFRAKRVFFSFWPQKMTLNSVKWLFDFYGKKMMWIHALWKNIWKDFFR